MIEEHLLGERRALAERKKLQHLVFLARQVNALTRNLNGLGVEINHQVARMDDRLRMALRTTNDGVDTRNQLILVERLGHVVVGTETKAPHLVFNTGHARENEDRGLHLGQAQSPQDLITRHVRQVQVKEDDVIIIQLAEIDTLFTQISRIDIEALRLEHQFDALCRRAIVFNQQNTHIIPLSAAEWGWQTTGTRAITA